MSRLALLMIGAELLDGRTHETNSHYLIGELTAAGHEVITVASCDDDETVIASALRGMSRDVDAIIVSGGLGPTTDDLTREAVASVAGVKLIRREASIARLRELFTRKQRPFDPSNEKQALFPDGASVIPNNAGTAEGFALHLPVDNTARNVLVTALPGVPGELRAMFKESVLPLLSKLPHAEPLIRKTIRVFGLTEAAIGSRVSGAGIDPALVIAYRAAYPEVQVQLKGRDRELCEREAARAVEAIGSEYVFSESAEIGFDLALHLLLLEKRVTIATAESCTGGRIGALLTRNSGSSEFFLGGVVSYSNELKTSLLGVRPETLAQHGAVSHETAREMAQGARERLGSDIAISVTGIAGPGGGSAEKPTGTVYAGLADASGVSSYRFFFDGARERTQIFAAWNALDLVRRRLSGLPLRSHE